MGKANICSFCYVRVMNSASETAWHVAQERAGQQAPGGLQSGHRKGIGFNITLIPSMTIFYVGFCDGTRFTCTHYLCTLSV